MKLNLTKQNGTLIPFDDTARDAIAKWKEGEFLELEVKKPRNSQYHRKFFKLLAIVLQNTDAFKSLDELLGYVKIETGWVDIITYNHMAFRLPKSIAFHKMDNTEFDIFYNKAVDVCLQMVPMDKEDLATEIAERF